MRRKRSRTLLLQNIARPLSLAMACHSAAVMYLSAGGVCAPRASRLISFGIQPFDAFLLTFHQTDDRSNFPRPAIEQLLPQVYVFAVVMRMQVDTQNVDVVANCLRSLDVTCLHVPDQTRQSAELPPEGRVHHVHVAGIRARTSVRHFLPLIYSSPPMRPPVDSVLIVRRPAPFP
jgi:hypothetical protein